MTELSVVVPVYKCERCLVALHQRLVKSLSELTDQFEIILVEDASPDSSWRVMQDLAMADHRVQAIQLSRNFGQHAAITAGLAATTGKYAVVMDCDLQDPPEEIAQFYAKAQEGYEVVYAKRKRKKHSTYRQLSSRLYFWMLNRFAPYPIDPEYGSFSMVSRPVIDAYLKIRNHSQHYLFMLHWLGFKSTFIEYAHGDREDQGTSSYTLSQLIRFALEGLFLQTTTLLRWIVYFGFFFALTGFFTACIILYKYFTQSILPGWTSLSVLILLVGGVMIISLGIVGLYIGKIFEQVQGRPHYVVARRIVNGAEV